MLAMRDFQDSTLWRVSGFERTLEATGTSGFARLGGPTLLPTTLLADLRRLDADPDSNDALEVVAACMRHRQAALLFMGHEGLVWPVTLFPQQMLYHAPRDLLAQAAGRGLASLQVLSAEPPGVRTPGSWLDDVHEAGTARAQYRPLSALLWGLALQGPRTTLLAEIGGVAAYRAIRSPVEDGLVAPGALRPAAERLRRETVALRTVAGWPGMSVERASRLLNALYLISALIASRAHPAAR